MRQTALCLALLVTACPNRHPGARPENNCVAGDTWTNWGRSATHTGTACAQAQPLTHIQSDLVYDPFAEAEKAEAGGDLLAHYQSPLVAGDELFTESKEGQYVSCSPPGGGKPAPCGAAAWDQQVWTEKKYAWNATGQLELAWRAVSDWKPPPDANHLGGWEPVFHGALGPLYVYLPGAGGSVLVIDRSTGAQVRRIDPLHNPLAYVAGPITADAGGNIVWTAVELTSASAPWTSEAHGCVMKATPDGAVQMLELDAAIPAAPAPTDRCEVSYPRPDPQNPPVLPLEDGSGNVQAPPTVPCGFQRPQLNAAPAIGPDGAIYVVTRTHRNERYGYLLALNPDLTPRWSTSLRGLVNDGCGVTVPRDDTGGHCHSNAAMGIDPDTGNGPAARASDQSTASPVVLPDGKILYGAYAAYNGFRGHTLQFDSAGHFLHAYDFGWDTTPAFFEHDGTYSIVLKDNHYDTDGPYFLTQLDAALNVEWKYQSTNTQSCARQTDGSVACKNDHPGGFEWCVNALAIDADGVVYGNSEDGNLYSIYQGGNERQRIFLGQALGAAYTPLAIDGRGRIYTQNSGHLYVVGQ